VGKRRGLRGENAGVWWGWKGDLFAEQASKKTEKLFFLDEELEIVWVTDELQDEKGASYLMLHVVFIQHFEVGVEVVKRDTLPSAVEQLVLLAHKAVNLATLRLLPVGLPLHLILLIAHTSMGTLDDLLNHLHDEWQLGGGEQFAFVHDILSHHRHIAVQRQGAQFDLLDRRLGLLFAVNDLFDVIVHQQRTLQRICLYQPRPHLPPPYPHPYTYAHTHMHTHICNSTKMQAEALACETAWRGTRPSVNTPTHSGMRFECDYTHTQCHKP